MKHLKYLCICLVIVVSPILATCGGSSGGGQSGGSGASSSSTSSGPTILGTISAIITGTTPTVSLTNAATADFTGQPNLVGSSVKISSVVDANLNSVAVRRENDLDVNLGTSETILIELDGRPKLGVPVVIHSAAIRMNIADNVYPAIYFLIPFNSTDWHPSDAGEDDEGDIVTPIIGNSDLASGTVSGVIPVEAFAEGGNGKYIARLKVGLANAYSYINSNSAAMSVSAIRPRSNASLTQELKLPCPLGTFGCVENSRFNLRRSISEYKVEKPHYGTDFITNKGGSFERNIFVPAGGMLFKGVSQNGTPAQFTQYDLSREKPACLNTHNSSACADVNYYSGVKMTIRYPDYQLTLIHLSKFSDIFINGNTPDYTTLTALGAPVAISGDTGKAQGRPHLHYQIQLVSVICKKAAAEICNPIIGPPVDAFPHIASDVVLRESAGLSKLKKDTVYSFEMEAKDYLGNDVSSKVTGGANGPPNENGGAPCINSKKTDGSQCLYSPNRKFCLTSLSPDTIQFGPAPDSAATFNGINGSYCASWGTKIQAKAIASNPTTTIAASYSKDPSVSVAIDPQVITGASVDLLADNVTANVSVSPNTIAVGDSATVSWSSANATSCTESGAWSGGQTSGSLTVSPTSSGTYIYVMTCQGPGGPALSTTTLTVTSLPLMPLPSPICTETEVTFFYAVNADITQQRCVISYAREDLLYGDETDVHWLDIDVNPTIDGWYAWNRDFIPPVDYGRLNAVFTVSTHFQQNLDGNLLIKYRLFDPQGNYIGDKKLKFVIAHTKYCTLDSVAQIYRCP